MNWDIYKQLADRWYEGYKHKLTSNNKRSEIMEKVFVTDDELTVLRLYRSCDKVGFTEHSLNKIEEREFASILGKPDYTKYDGAECFGLSKGKIGVAAFIKQGGAE